MLWAGGMMPTAAAPAIVRPSVRRSSIVVEPLTASIGAELRNVSLADAARDGDLADQIYALLLRHKVLFLR
ncbi:MAG TPA: hypothetical protein VFP65_00225, partial [Anaeromyxobacteraceae bacterium]|nr:hypothetical protein [Anaeromyxobacteraceae bacterium]